MTQLDWLTFGVILQKCTSLRVLKMSNCELLDPIATLLCSYLKNKNTLRELDLSGK